MDYQPRTIAFLSEVFHQPRPPEPRPVQKLHNAMFQEGAPDYSSFAVTPAGPVLANPPLRPGATSQVAFLADRMQFREELGAMTIDAFAQRLTRVVGGAAPLLGLQDVKGHQVTLRSLVNPRHFSDTREFLHEAVFGFDDEMDVFQRRPHMYGLRLAFPPEEGRKNAYGLRIESYNSDTRSLYVEIQGTYGGTRIDAGLQPLADNVHATYRFLEEHALPFVAQFDARQPS